MNDLKERHVKEEGDCQMGNHNSPMMLMMMICCGLPLLLFVVLPLVGLKLGSNGNVSWIFIGLIAAVACVTMLVNAHRKQR